MFESENPLVRCTRPAARRKPFPTINNPIVRVEIVPAAIDLPTPLAKNPPTRPAPTHVINRGV